MFSDEQGVSKSPASLFIGVKFVQTLKAEASLVQVSRNLVEEAAAFVPRDEVDFAEDGPSRLQGDLCSPQGFEFIALQVEFDRIGLQAKLIERDDVDLNGLRGAELAAGSQERRRESMLRNVEGCLARGIGKSLGVKPQAIVIDARGPLGERRIRLEGVYCRCWKQPQKVSAGFEVVRPAVDNAFSVRDRRRKVGGDVSMPLNVEAQRAEQAMQVSFHLMILLTELPQAMKQPPECQPVRSCTGWRHAS